MRTLQTLHYRLLDAAPCCRQSLALRRSVCQARRLVACAPASRLHKAAAAVRAGLRALLSRVVPQLLSSEGAAGRGWAQRAVRGCRAAELGMLHLRTPQATAGSAVQRSRRGLEEGRSWRMRVSASGSADSDRPTGQGARAAQCEGGVGGLVRTTHLGAAGRGGHRDA